MWRALMVFSCALPTLVVYGLGCTTAQGPGSAAPKVNAPHVIATVSEVGLHNTDSESRVRIYSKGTVYYGRLNPLTLLDDTVSASGLQPFIADITLGDLVIEVVGKGNVRIAGAITNGPSSRITAAGKRIILLRGGVGVDMSDH